MQDAVAWRSLHQQAVLRRLGAGRPCVPIIESDRQRDLQASPPLPGNDPQNRRATPRGRFDWLPLFMESCRRLETGTSLKRRTRSLLRNGVWVVVTFQRRRAAAALFWVDVRRLG
jgi:hypothetical protein